MAKMHLVYRDNCLSLGIDARGEENRREIGKDTMSIVTAGPTIRSGARTKLSFMT